MPTPFDLLAVLHGVQVFAVERLKQCNYSGLIAQVISGDKQKHSRRSQARQNEVVGREFLLNTMQAALLRVVQTGNSGTVMITGEPGFGKTRVLQHFLNSEDIRGSHSRLHVCLASGKPEQRCIPMTPWRSVVQVRRSRICFCTSAHSLHDYWGFSTFKIGACYVHCNICSICFL